MELDKAIVVSFGSLSESRVSEKCFSEAISIMGIGEGVCRA